MTDKIQYEGLEGEVLTSLYAPTEHQFQTSRKVNEEAMASSGFVHSGKHRNDGIWQSVNQGMSGGVTLPNLLFMGRLTDPQLGTSKTNYPVVNLAGVITKLLGVNNDASGWGATIKFPDAPDGTVTYDSATGAIVQHVDAATAFATETATNKVVTERVDHFGLEGFLEEVTLANPYVYPKGLIQSQATTMNGIATSASARPATYYAVFDGDTTSDGLGVNYWAASDTEKAAMLSDPDNNIYVGSDGKVYQFRIRQRTIAGAGNGDWEEGRTNVIGTAAFGWDSETFITPQGINDTVVTFKGTTTDLYLPAASSWQTTNAHTGVYTALQSSGVDSTAAVNGECYWLPLGTVLRLNQGAYHPSFNPLGASFFKRQSDYNGKKFWYEKTDAPIVSSIADCFDIAPATVPSKVVDWFGFIASGDSGRPDDRYYDAIYADGKGGVVDLRLSAQGGTISDILGTEDARTKNGTQRGLQKLGFTTVGTGTVSGSANGNFAELPTSDNPYLGFTGSVLPNVPRDTVSSTSPSRYHYVYNATDGLIYPCHALVESGGITYVAQEGSWLKEENSRLDTVNLVGKTCYMVVIEETHLSVSGEFSQTDVIGDPANILATPDLANGWLGNWIPVIPDGTTLTPELVRKSLVTTASRVSSGDNGSSWSSDTRVVDAVNNTITTAAPIGWVEVIIYTAHAYMTESANNPVVYKGTEGVGDVFQYCWNATKNGVLLAESTLRKVLTNNNSGSDVYSTKLLKSFAITPDNGSMQASSNYLPVHEAITLAAPANNSSGLKTLSLAAEENGQLFLYYLSTELIWDTTLDSGSEFIDRSGTASEGYTEGFYYHVTGGKFQGYWRSESSATINLDTSDWYIGADGNIYNSVGSLRLSVWAGNGWGDDNLITVLDGEGTKTDLNGNTVKVSCHKVPYALGWVKNEI